MSDKQRAHLVEDLGDGTGKYSDNTRRWLAKNDQGKHPGGLADLPPHLVETQITSDNAHEFLERRELLKMRAAWRVMERDGRTIPSSLESLLAAQYELAHDIEQGQAASRAFDTFLRHAGFSSESDNRPVIAIQVNFGDDMVARYTDEGDV